MRGVMPLFLSACLQRGKSYALSACSFAGRLRGLPGRPRGLRIGEMASTASTSTFESWTLAALRTTASGMPPRSETTWRFEPAFALSVGFGPVLWPPFGRHACRVQRSPLPVDPVGLPEPVQERLMQLFPHARLLPVAQAPPAGRSRSAAHLLGEHLPGYAALEDENDAGKSRAVVDAGPAAIGFGRLFGQQRFYDLPKLVRY